MLQIVPYNFDPPITADRNDEHLNFEVVPGGMQVSWPLIGASLFVPDDGVYVSLDATAVANADRLTIHGGFGFSLDTYHEFFMQGSSSFPAGFSMGGIEATFGDVSPLAALLFEGRRSKWNGEWEHIASLRIVGAPHEDAELACLNACARYFERTGGEWPEPFRIGDVWMDEPEDEDLSAISSGKPMFTQIEPLRFLAAGAQQTDDLAACVYYYRVIEYLSFFVHEREIWRLRHDANLADAQFSRKMLDLITRDEKGPIIRLVQSLADRPILEDAKNGELIERASPQVYAERLYEFRNSIVHGKFSYGFTLSSPSLFGTEDKIGRWRVHLLAIARRAIAASF